MAKELKGLEAIKHRLTSKELLKFVDENRIRIRTLEARIEKLERPKGRGKA